MTTTVCSRSGCGVQFDPSNNVEGSCRYHSGAPIFHEGLKSWSCCNDVSKPVMEFEAFTRIPGCTKSSHRVKPATPASTSTSSTASKPSTPAPTIVSGGVETYGALPSTSSSSTRASEPSAPVALPSNTEGSTAAAVGASPPEEENDDPNAVVPEGAACKRRACGAKFDGSSREGCVHHPGVPIFREGSKGYSCCKRRVLEFDEFLKIEGCKTSRHLFVGAARPVNADGTIERELVTSRVDHYQSPTTVHVSVFAKGIEKATSKIVLEPEQIHLDLHLPQNRRTLRTLNLHAPIDPSRSTFSIFGTKLELTLQKADGSSWPVLEKLSNGGASLPKGYALTFGVGGRTGSVGAKEMILSEEQQRRKQEEETRKVQA